MSLTKKVLHKRHLEKCANGSGSVSSWNDLTDKPFYEEETIIASCDVEIIYNNELQDYEWHSYMLPNTIYDKTVEYKIIVDNEVYYSKVKSGYAQGVGSLYYIGANLPYSDESNNDYPFCLYCPNPRAVGDNLIRGEFRYNPRAYEADNHLDIHKSIQIIDPTQMIVHPIEPKFIPNADWEQSDENGEGYIKNKPFSDHPYKLNGLPSNSEIRIEESSDVGYYYVSDLLPPDNMDYIFVGLGLDGYECEVTTVSHYPAKNYDAYFIQESNYPYIIVAFQDNVQDTDILGRAITFPKMGVYFYYSPAGGNTVTAFMGGGITKIDKKFIPNDIDIIFKSSTRNSNKKFRISIDDSGTISAVEVIE